MNSLIPCLGLLLLVFGGRLGPSEALAVPFMTSQPSDSDRETLTSLLRGGLPLSEITGDLNVARDMYDDGADATETSGHNGWMCHGYLCTNCFTIAGHRYCIWVIAHKPVGFIAVAIVDKFPFLATSVTSPGFNAVATGILPYCWFGMAFTHIDVKQRSATAYAELKCSHFQRRVALGSFKIPMKAESGEGDAFNFGTGLSGLSEAVEALVQGDE